MMMKFATILFALLWWAPSQILAVATISTNKATYAFNEAIQVTYRNQNPQTDDFIAIYPAVTSNQNLRTGYLWLFTCGQQSSACPTRTPSGVVTFAKGVVSSWEQTWPLIGGQYIAYLLRSTPDAEGRFLVIAQSTAFQVVQNSPPGSPFAARTALAQAKADIANMVFLNSTLIPKFLRMGFHDCVGDGCDGCIDLTNPDNNGLELPIDVIAPVVQKYANNKTGLSRADIWALAATVGVDVANHGTTKQPILFEMKWYGRVDCEAANKVCFNAKGSSVPCNAKRGPHRTLPSVNLNTRGVFKYFADNFNFNQRQTLAIMGGHTVGQMRPKESGINGQDGWTINNKDVQNEYYNALMNGASSTLTDDEIYKDSPFWKRIFFNNSNIANTPNRFAWRLNIGGKQITMTNADIALARDLNSGNLNPSTGQVSCAFRPGVEDASVQLCPILRSTFPTLTDFSTNNDLWLSEFKDALARLLTNGYQTARCNFATFPFCKLIPN